jgi:hypothetical protein
METHSKQGLFDFSGPAAGGDPKMSGNGPKIKHRFEEEEKGDFIER